MDPVTQGVLGATAALLVANKKQTTRAAITGCLGGLAADADIIIKSTTDPLLALEYHRQFTHSLVFIPIGGLLVALLLWAVFFRRHALLPIYLYATAGYATHALLDACTSYGTLLLWPFSLERFAWDSISIIDPLITLPLLVGVILCCLKHTKVPVYCAASFFALYLSFGFVQQQRALDATYTLAQQNGHSVVRARAMPTLANLIVWRSLYEADGKYYVNAIRVSLLGKVKVFAGERIEKLDMQRDFPLIKEQSTQYLDVERFAWFAQGWLVRDPNHDNAVSDLRYSPKSDSTQSLWRIEFDSENPEHHVQYQQADIGTEREILPMDKLLGRTK